MHLNHSCLHASIPTYAHSRSIFLAKLHFHHRLIAYILFIITHFGVIIFSSAMHSSSVSQGVGVPERSPALANPSRAPSLTFDGNFSYGNFHVGKSLSSYPLQCRADKVAFDALHVIYVEDR